MKTTTFPPLLVSPALRKEAESVLDEGETLSAMVLGAVTRDIELRKFEREFIARGIASGRKAKQTGKYVSAANVLSKLRKHLTIAQRKSTHASSK